MNLKTIHNVYFIGIGGVGMSALAKYFVALGKNVGGYDKVSSAITESLLELGIDIQFETTVNQIDESFINPSTTLVVFTPAISKSNVIFQYFETHNFKILKRSEVLGLVTELTQCLAVAGTHGKTTTSSILGHLMYECNEKVTAFIGGITENYQSNLIQNGTEISVVEADEFDRSFLTLRPDFACITSMDADHLDVYSSEEDLAETFKAFTKKIKPSGKLFVRKGLPLEGITYGVNEDADYAAVNVRIEKGLYCFDLKTPSICIENIQFHLPGTHNVSNAVAAMAMALEFGCDAGSLTKALKTYKGVKRRFTYQIKSKEFVFIDDYAHHPKEINAVYQAVREMYPTEKVAVVFQPHLFSRTRDFVDAFAESLSQFDAVFLLEIYPARELPISGVTSSWLLDKINSPVKKLISKPEIVTEIKNIGFPVMITLGAGDIGVEVSGLKKKLSYAY
ncbi:UDP-N-acetylmuramate--L-alanine ligase [Flavobacteriaceae bacterium]|jgi:UDP-N-acetylmuramate--alanine ligase|nr:UDP-N-acetylmuramate--L-alanine ligase [Flavobacteriaceae bacterium]MDC1195530.1 UDP-N-acetylmuramate--L-alanine ligase [Flavobacteriaceae bacterium]MDG1385099.1 UDP-N-acetylmuramate--L-alanine ligase [Flavobacteriaceae bacterium]